MAPPLPGDKRAGYMGLIFGGIAIFLIAWGIVHLTNKSYEGEKAHEAPAATEAGH
jgi:hypothetical protein